MWTASSDYFLELVVVVSTGSTTGGLRSLLDRRRDQPRAQPHPGAGRDPAPYLPPSQRFSTTRNLQPRRRGLEPLPFATLTDRARVALAL
jgi:hypothetical protein